MDEIGSAFAIWLPNHVVKKYKELKGYQRKLVRNAVKLFIAELVERAGNLENANVAVQNFIFNVNMPVAMVKLEDTNDVELMKERIRELEREKNELEEMLRNLKVKAAKAEALEAELKKANSAIRGLNDLLKKYEERLRVVRDFIEGKISCEELKTQL